MCYIKIIILIALYYILSCETNQGYEPSIIIAGAKTKNEKDIEELASRCKRIENKLLNEAGNGNYTLVRSTHVIWESHSYLLHFCAPFPIKWIISLI